MKKGKPMGIALQLSVSRAGLVRHCLLWLIGLCLPTITATAQPAAQPTEGYLPRFSRRVTPARRVRIPLRLDYPPEFGLETWPVTFGVPFPRGALAAVDSMRIVDQNGTEVPAQIERTATWDAPDGPVKWALIEIAARRGDTYAVEAGTEVTPRTHPSPLQVVDQGKSISVTTGPLQLTVSRSHSALIYSARLDLDADGIFSDSESILADSQRMQVQDQNGRPYLTSDSPQDYTVEVESAGPQRAVIKATGWYRDAAGTGPLSYVTRLHLYAGQAFVRIVHTFVVHCDTDTTQFSGMAIPFAGTVGADARGVIQAGTGFAAPIQAVPLPARIIQDSTNHFSITDGAGQVLREGTRCGGWAGLAGRRSGLSVALRNMWQDHQKELEVTAEGIVAYLWPAHGNRLLDFRASEAYGAERYQQLDDIYYKRWYEGGLDAYDQAMGLAKTNELIVAFHGTDPAAARAACAALEQPPFVVADPEWMCRSDAFGPLHPHDPERFPDLEKAFTTAFERYEWLRDHLDSYGFFDYGDVSYRVNWDEQSQRWRESSWRRMASRFYGISLMPWIMYARTGERRYRQWAVDNARHVMDIDVCHVTAKVPGYPFAKWRGGRYGGNGGIIHYGADIYDIGCDSHVTPWLYAYYLTGCRRALDVFAEEGEFYLALNTPGFMKSGNLQRYAHRMTGGALRTLIQYWWATWDPRYLERAQTLAEFCYEAAAENDGVIRHDDVYMNAGLVTYYQATGDERMKEVILTSMREVDSGTMVMADPRAYTFYGPAMAYYFSGDAAYLRRPLAWLERYPKAVNQGDDPARRGVPEGHWDMCHNGVHLLYAPYLMAALTTLDAPLAAAPPRDTTASRTEIWVNNPQGRAATFTVEWSCYKRPDFIGVAVRNWPEYCQENNRQARLTALTADGQSLASAPILLADTAHGGTLTLDVPGGTPGILRLTLQDAADMPLRFRLQDAAGLQWVYPLEGNAITRPGNLFFQTPGDAGHISLGFKALALRTAMDVTVLDSAGETVHSERFLFGSSPLSEWAEWHLEVPPDERGTVWSLQIRPPGGDQQEVFLRLEGPPPVVSTTPEMFFPPPPDLHPQTPTPAPSPRGVAEPVLSIAPDQPLLIPRGEPLAEGGYAGVNPTRGTIEFWLRGDWPVDDLSDSTILSCGDLRLFRRAQIGTYLNLGTAYIQSGYCLQPGTWNHVAIGWDLEKDRDRTGICINGTPFGTPYRGRSGNNIDWTGDALAIGGTVPFQITGLRVWNHDRRAQIIEGSLSPEPDRQCLYPHGQATAPGP